MFHQNAYARDLGHKLTLPKQSSLQHLATPGCLTLQHSRSFPIVTAWAILSGFRLTNIPSGQKMGGLPLLHTSLHRDRPLPAAWMVQVMGCHLLFGSAAGRDRTLCQWVSLIFADAGRMVKVGCLWFSPRIGGLCACSTNGIAHFTIFNSFILLSVNLAPHRALAILPWPPELKNSWIKPCVPWSDPIANPPIKWR